MPENILNHGQLARVERETDGAPLHLDYRSHPTSDADDRRFTVAVFTGFSLAAAGVVLSLHFIGQYFATPWSFAVFTLLGLVATVIAAINRAGLLAATAFFVGGPALPLVMATLHGAARSQGPMLLLGALAAFLLAYMIDRFVTHYVTWLLASPRVLPEARAHYRSLWASRFNPLKSLSQAGIRPLATYPLFLLIPAVLLTIMSYTATAPRARMVSNVPYPVLFPQAVLASAFIALLSIGAAVLFFMRGRRMLRAFLTGLQTWCTYGAGQVNAPGIFRSPAGTQQRRVVATAAVLFFVSYALLPGAGFFSLLLEADHSPWGQLLSESFQPRQSDDPLQMMRFPFTRLYAAQVGFQIPTDIRAADTGLLALRYFDTGPMAWIPLALDGVATGRPYFLWSLMVGFLFSLVGPILILLGFLAVATGIYAAPFIHAVQSRNSDVVAGERVSDWECYVSAVEKSPNGLEANHLWLGAHAYDDYPVLLDRAVLSEHAYIVGDTGSGKTALGVSPILLQLIRQRDSGIVIIDLKGDPALFHAAREEANKAGLAFKFFTNERGKATYTFNPFLQAAFETLSLNQICENLLEALNLNHGEGYGRSYFSRVARSWLTRTLNNHKHVRSFTELNEIAEHADNFRDRKKERQDVFELLSVLETLASIDQLNITPRKRKPSRGKTPTDYPDSVRENAIHMPRVVAENQVVYFWLPAIIESATVREIAKLALYALVQAARQQTLAAGKPKQSYLFIDEFQRIASDNFKIILEQARSFGVGVILANQNIADLKTTEVDLRPTVQTNTRFKQCFSSVDVMQQELLMTASGEAIDYRYSYSTNLLTERKGGRFPRHDVRETHTFSEYSRPRLQRNDIIRASDDPLESIIQIHRGSGYTQFSGFSIPIVGGHTTTKEDYERRTYREPWPAHVAGETIANEREPLEEFETLEARVEAGQQTAPAAATIPEDEQLDDELERVRRHRLATLEQRRWRTKPVKPPVTHEE